MQLFTCQNCGQVTYFENTHCEACHKQLGYLPRAEMLSVIEPEGDGFRAVKQAGHFRLCSNAQYDVCNWLVAEGEGDFCLACRHNGIVPDLSMPDNQRRWRKIELAKHHLFYSLVHLGLPLRNRVEDPQFGLTFNFLIEEGSARVMTGHEDGVITLNLAEADDAQRELMRETLGEPYRTLLGHFRHEVGHYFWDELIARGGLTEAFRERFGDERPDYEAALQAYYASGPRPDWHLNFVSAYASSHPWEDFAETWAHYLHIIDTMEMAEAFGLRLKPQLRIDAIPEITSLATPPRSNDMRALIDRWVPVTLAVNSINRCMGQPDLYPFVLTSAVVAKLDFIHELVHGRLSGGALGQPAVNAA